MSSNRCCWKRFGRKSLLKNSSLKQHHEFLGCRSELSGDFGVTTTHTPAHTRFRFCRPAAESHWNMNHVPAIRMRYWKMGLKMRIMNNNFDSAADRSLDALASICWLDVVLIGVEILKTLENRLENRLRGWDAEKREAKSGHFGKAVDSLLPRTF